MKEEAKNSTYMREACCQCEQKKFFLFEFKVGAEIESVDD